jgi:TldD protein
MKRLFPQSAILLAAMTFATACPASAFAAHVISNPSAGERTAAINSDPLLKAMEDELDRERELLLLPGMQRPYFIEYRVDDFQTYDAIANYGALTREERNHQRVVRVTVRIGDYASDSSSSRGDGSIELAPEDNDPAALRYALWTATDEA